MAPTNAPSQNIRMYTTRRFRERASLCRADANSFGSDMRAAYGVVIIAVGNSLVPELAAFK